MALCFKSRPDGAAGDALAARALQIVAATKLPAKSWVKGISAAQ